MSDNTERKPDPNPDHDRHAAGIYRAIALRFYFRYVDARTQANFRGEDLVGTGPLPTPREAGDRYQRAVDEWLGEEPSTPAAVLSLVEFAAVIAADRFAGEAMRDPGPVSDEKDAFHQTVALSAVGDWLNANVVAGDWLSRRIAAYGPTAVPQKGEAAAVSRAEPDAELLALIAEHQRLYGLSMSPAFDPHCRAEDRDVVEELWDLRGQIYKIRPSTPAGLLGVLDVAETTGVMDEQWWPKGAIAGLREIAEREAKQ